MSRLSRDGLILQAHLGKGESMTLAKAARELFNDGKREVTPIANARALRAARNLIAMRRAEPVPAKGALQGIISRASNGGVQCEAVMNMMVRSGREQEIAADLHQQAEAFVNKKKPLR